MTLRAIAASLLALLVLTTLAAPASAAPAKRARPAAAAAPVLVIKTATGSHVVGRATAPVKLVEYVSYTCPHCADFERESHEPLMATLVRPGKVSVEYRPFLRNVVDIAATLLANCGGAARFQGNHTALMQNQATWFVVPGEEQVQRWNTGDLPTRIRTVAVDLKLYAMFTARGYTRAQLDACLADQAQVDAIAKENQTAIAAGVQATPSFLINGQLQDVHGWNDLRGALDVALR